MKKWLKILPLISLASSLSATGCFSTTQSIKQKDKDFDEKAEVIDLRNKYINFNDALYLNTKLNDLSTVKCFNSEVSEFINNKIFSNEKINQINSLYNNALQECFNYLKENFIEKLNWIDSEIVKNNLIKNVSLEYQNLRVIIHHFITLNTFNENAKNKLTTLTNTVNKVKELKLFADVEINWEKLIDANFVVNEREIKNIEYDLITKTVKNYIEYFSKGNFFPLIVERLTYFKNHFDFGLKEHTMQWFITKDKKFTLSPGNVENIEWRLPYMRDRKYGLIKFDSEYIISWLKNYDEWLWLINDEEKIGKISLENVKAFNHYKDFKNEFIANEFKDYENFNINVIGWKRNIDEEKTLNSLYEELIKIYGKSNFEINNWDSKIYFSDNPYIPNNFDFDLYKKYLNNSIKSAEASRPIIYDLLTEKPNYFSDFQQNSLSSLKLRNEFIYKEKDVNKNYDFPGINKLTKNKYGGIDYSNYEDKETTRNQFIQWRKNWEELLSKFISKNWNQKQIILALSFYITSNVMYMYENNKLRLSFNTNGTTDMNPSSLFETDRTLQCYGYSQNLSLALTLLNIPVRIITGKMFSNTQNPLVSSGGHAWNEVFIDNKWVSVDLTFADYQESWSNFNSEINLEEIFLDRDSGSRTMFRLDFLSYITTIIKYLNKDENGNYVHNYIELPTHYSTDPENELKWENMLPLLRQQYKQVIE
ncbi:transglutaminase-like domain-containing protein [Mycoplasma anserisalpingitidis]|uniref:transglutaminase-like domain-containing protein n=1 Tax=Mycoplasma anserisalpingitidis TaxID=519450 RepID=UPI001CF6F295|nr:transglutaminase-like domain-containing protein [Mycoplasma anserisalpingitidis]UCU26839.1 transglutaminase-like domain-containing protein [Mycoplasma anserisalpingitidis]UCU27678.1 transglutaminase-like domain-containing protein [Mycoplasma anserisalpingitidis]